MEVLQKLGTKWNDSGAIEVYGVEVSLKEWMMKFFYLTALKERIIK